MHSALDHTSDYKPIVLDDGTVFKVTPQNHVIGCFCWWETSQKFPIWWAHGGSIQDYSIQGTVLRSQGKCIGTVYTLSSTIEETPLPTHENFTSMQTRHSSPRHSYLVKALYCLLTLAKADCPYHLSDQSLDYFRHLFASENREQLQRAVPSVLAWLELNRSLDIFGCDLENCISASKWGFHFPILLQREPTKRGATNITIPWLYKSMQSILEMGMRLATYSLGLGWVDSSTRPGDQICMLQGCCVPVVIRAREAGGWNLVGDAIIFDGMKGMFMHPKFGEFEYLDIH